MSANRGTGLARIHVSVLCLSPEPFSVHQQFLTLMAVIQVSNTSHQVRVIFHMQPQAVVLQLGLPGIYSEAAGV